MNTRMARGAAIAAGLLAASSLGTALAGSSVTLREARIPFANHGAISDWQPDRKKGLWVQANNRQWYYATFIGPCFGLDFATTLGFDTGPMGSLDRWSAVYVPRQGKCTFNSFEQSDGPPSRQAKG